MHIRTFRAACLQDALEDIRLQMGDHASVLYTRQIREGWMGWLGKTSVEVTAGLRDEQLDVKRKDSIPTATGGEGHAGNQPVRDAAAARCGYPLELQDLRALLVYGGADDVVADRWIEETYHQSIAASVAVEPGRWIDELRKTVARGLRVAGPIELPAGQRRVVALVGPTGVGKTTTIAKLAAGFRLEAQCKVALITIDTFRIAAVEQLRAYAQIMDLPMEVVQSADQMRPALARLHDADLVLIDTTGRSPRSDDRLEHLRMMLAMAQPHETHLVLSATSSRNNLQTVFEGFSCIRPTASILTKLDEASQLAGVLSSFDGHALPLSYVTTGQQVPDDIETADVESLVQGLLAPHMAAAPLPAPLPASLPASADPARLHVA